MPSSLLKTGKSAMVQKDVAVGKSTIQYMHDRDQQRAQGFLKHCRRTSARRRGFRLPCSCSQQESYLASFASRVQKQKTKGLLPSLELNQEQAVTRQLQVLKDNNHPYPDHGIEIMYRFSNFDPFQRSMYFGRSLDLGQFERFRRIFHTPQYSVLLCHEKNHLLSSLKISEHRWSQRVGVQGMKPNVFGEFTFTMVQRIGGHFDGIWFCESLLSEVPPDIHT